MWFVPKHKPALNQAKTRMYWNGVSFLTNGVIRLAPKRCDGEVSFCWRAPVAGFFHVDIQCRCSALEKAVKFSVNGKAFSGSGDFKLEKGDCVAVATHGADAEIDNVKITLLDLGDSQIEF